MLATPVVAWWLVGDLSFSAEQLDYAVEPPRLTDGEERLLGGSATAVAITGAVALLIGVRRGGLRLIDLAPATPLIRLGVFLGFGVRVLTAGGIGANIGAGLVAMVAPLLIVIDLGATFGLCWVRWWITRAAR